jgi:hypothetical protein
MIALRHQILEDGRVLVTLKGQIARLSPNEVKRFAWAVLNDLDPEEADNSGYVAAPIMLGSDRPPEVVGKGAWQLMAILERLAQGEAYTTNVSAKLVISRSHAAIQLGRLLKRGWVNRISEGRACWPALWEITDAGRQALADHEQRFKA